MSRRSTDLAKQSRTADILLRLAESITDGQLQECIPEIPPAQVRAALLEASGRTTRQHEEGAGEIVPKPKSKVSHSSIQTVSLFTDGASRGNPGEAGAGFAIFDDAARELYAGGKYLGQCTNNEAEYRALLLGLEKVHQLGAKTVDVKLDSELIARQISGRYRVKNENLKRFFKAVMIRLTAFDSYTVTHVRRELNGRADELANRAIDEKQV